MQADQDSCHDGGKLEPKSVTVRNSWWYRIVSEVQEE